MFLVPTSQVGPSGITMSFVTATTSSGTTITLPATILAGDLLVIFHTARDSGSTPSAVTPSGFTLIATATAANNRLSGHYIIAAGTEDGTTRSVISGNQYNSSLCMQFRGAPALASLTVGHSTASVTDSTPTTETAAVNALGAQPIVAMGFYSSETGVATRTSSITADGETAQGTTSYVKRWVFPAGHADFTVSMTDNGDGNACWAVWFYNFA